MLFNSVEYLVFLFIAVSVFLSLPRAARKIFIIVASIVFYSAWSIKYLFLLGVVVVFNYIYAGFLMPRWRNRFTLFLGISADCLPLFIYKYSFFAVHNISYFTMWFGVHMSVPRLALPLGISFYTFEAISFVIECYQGRIVRPGFMDYCVYMLFWPRLIAGPIVRPHEILPQIQGVWAVNWDARAQGLRRVASGLFKKTVLADGMGAWITPAFNMGFSHYSALDVWTLAVGFGFQIYFDFSAYSDIAIGSALLLGIRLPENFNYPYLAVSVSEFWQRWHMTLTRWVRDYVFFPLSIRASRLQLYVSVALTMLIIGIWHGAAWTFVLWGLYHAVIMIVQRVFTAYFPKQKNRNWVRRIVDRKPIAWALTFGSVSLGWVLFRAKSVSVAASMFVRVFEPGQYMRLGMNRNIYPLVASYLLLFWLSVVAKRYVGSSKWREMAFWQYLAGAGYAVIMLVALAFLGKPVGFIYFQF